MRQILFGALLGVLVLAFGHTLALLAAPAVAHLTAQPAVWGFVLGCLNCPALTRKVSP